MINLLPSSSLIPFEARKLARPSLIWNLDHGRADAFVEQFAYAVPSDTDSEDSYLNIGKTFHAERYGGTGVAHNGGGVRCGVIHDSHGSIGSGLQVKGIGKNPLGSSASDFWYTHGGATLEEGIREAVWGEVCAIALPYGGSRVHAVIATGNGVAFDAPAGKCLVPGALIVRDAVLRPAHYMRAVYYKPTEHMMAHHPSDVERTKAAIQAIGSGFQAILGISQPSLLGAAYVGMGLQELARRFAVQLAAARLKKIVHGALTCSNIGFDGRLLDYGTITTVSDYRQIIVARNQPDMLSDHMQLLSTLKTLAFYCHKFLPDHAKIGLIDSDELARYFLATFQERVNIEFLKLTGVPEYALVKINPKIRIAMITVFNEIILTGNCDPFKLYTASFDSATWKMPEKMGHYHLSTILQRACLCIEPEQIDTQIASLLPDSALRQRFVGAYWNLRQAYLAEKTEASLKHAVLFMAINAYRVNQSFPELYRPHLVRSIDAIIESDNIEEATSALVRRLSSKARTLLADPHNNRIDLFSWTNKQVILDETTGPIHDGKPIAVTDFVELIDETVFSREQRQILGASCK